MASTILYKFRSGTTFEALPLPGTAARLFDVKRAIVKAKRLDATTGSSQLEFDLSVRDATTNEEYADESMILPRGTRVVVQRLPAARGHGFLSRMARADAGMGTSAPHRSAPTIPSGFYNIESHDREDEDEYVQTGGGGGDEEKELAALRAVTDQQDESGAVATGGFRPHVTTTRVAGSGPPPPPSRPGAHFGKPLPYRPSADPDLREQEKMPKKRATGIPRTFLNLSAPPVTDGTLGEGEGSEAVARLQPNAIGFEELVNRGGGQSEKITGTKRDLDYALKITATSIPEHLQCGICHGVVNNAMLLPWDTEGRTACESCIRDALTQNGFRCPLTGTEDVSMDDLHPNHGLRKAAELFIKGVMDKMDEIDQQKVDEPDDEDDAAAPVSLEGEGGDKGVIVSRKSMKDYKSKKNDDDPFGGGDDDFGGDVFDVAADEADEEAEKEDEADDAKEAEIGNEEPATSAEAPSPKEKDHVEGSTEEKSTSAKPAEDSKVTDDNSKMNKSKQSENTEAVDDSPSQNKSPAPKSEEDGTPHNAPSESRRDTRRRGPPAGYAMGPAGGSAVVRNDNGGPYSSPNGHGGSPHTGRGRGYDRGGFRGRGRGGRQGRFYDGRGGRGGYHQGRYDERNYQEEDANAHDEGDDDAHSRGTKRSRSESQEFNADDRYGGRGGRGWSGRGRYSDRSPYGGRFDSRGRGAPYRGGRGSYRGGRGGYGRGRY